jgi:protein phosphatase
VAAQRAVPLAVRAFGATDTGRLRRKNEDQFVVATLSSALSIEQSTIEEAGLRRGASRAHLIVVADGMGGHAFGEQASAVAAWTVEELLLNALGWAFALEDPDSIIFEELKRAVVRADEAVAREAAMRPEMRGMGTTLTLALSAGDRLYVAHAGDSRCYLLRAGVLYQITRDHTVIRELVAAGVLGPEEVERNQWRHVVTNVVGGGTPGVTAEVHELGVAPGDVLMLSTDGLHDMVGDDIIARILASQVEPRRACEALIDAANAAGGRDNITVVVARYEVPGPPAND